MDRSFTRLVFSVALAGVFVGWIAAPPAFAVTASDGLGQISSDESGTTGQKGAKDLSLLGFWNTMSGLQSTSDTNYSAESDFNLVAVYKLSDSYSLMGSFGFRKELTQQMRLLGQDGVVGVMHNPIQLGSYVRFTPSAGIRVPMSQQSLDYDSMYAGAQAGVQLDFSGKAIGVGRLSLTYIGTVGRDFYQYTQAQSGGILSAPNAPVLDGSAPQAGGPSPALINIEYDLKSIALLSYQLSNKFSLTETGIYLAGYDFDGDIRSNFEICEELDYQLARQIGLGVGFSNGGNVLMPDGQSSNVQIYNPNSSNVYGSVVLSY